MPTHYFRVYLLLPTCLLPTYFYRLTSENLLPYYQVVNLNLPKEGEAEAQSPPELDQTPSFISKRCYKLLLSQYEHV